MKKYIAAVSGGPDSMAMLNMYKGKISAVCHINYNKRKSALRDQKIVKQYCDQHKIVFCLLLVDPKSYKTNDNFQNEARKIRYSFFVKTCNEKKAKGIMIAHNKDDFVETAHMQKSRNSETLFWGIKKKTEYNGIKIWRPLINKRKKELTEYCDAKKIKYGIDETNEFEIYERNKVRKEISHWTNKKFNNFFSECKVYNKRNKKIENKVNKFYEKWNKKNFSINFFETLKQEIKHHVIYKFLIVNNIYISKNKIVQIIDFIKNGKEKTKLRMGNNVFLTKLNKCLTIVNNYN